MGSRLLCWVTLCLLGAGPVNPAVTQIPKHVIKARNQTVTLRCYYESGHQSVSWYQQTLGQVPQFLVEYYYEKERTKGSISDRFSVQQFRLDFRSELNISFTEVKDSALYLCASSPGQGHNSPLHFGLGTKLTVTDDLSQVKPPKVALFEPSEAEITQTQKATLVCLATGFFPDHVELSWWVNGKEVQSGVSTDPQAFKENDTSYCLSSRLRVSAAFWHDPRNHFRCQVHFYGLSQEDKWDDSSGKPKPTEQNVSAEAWGRADCGLTSTSYQQGILSATILYEILLGKATLYALLVSTLVLMAMVKKKGS